FIADPLELAALITLVTYVATCAHVAVELRSWKGLYCLKNEVRLHTPLVDDAPVISAWPFLFCQYPIVFAPVFAVCRFPNFSVAEPPEESAPTCLQGNAVPGSV